MIAIAAEIATPVLAIGEVITYERIAPMTYFRTIETAVIQGRNWYFEDFNSYIVRGGECVYPHQLIA